MNRKNFIRKKSLFVMLAATNLLNRLDMNIPTKWYSFLDSLVVSSGVLHQRLGFVDKEVEKEFREREELLEKQLGMKKFYSEKEIKKLRDNSDQINV